MVCLLTGDRLCQAGTHPSYWRLQNMFMLRSFALLLLGIAVSAGAIAHSAAGVSSETPGIEATPKQRAAQLFFSERGLITQDGKHVAFYSDVLRGHTIVINFIFTQCTDACPTQTARLAAAQALLPDAVRRGIAFVSISVDPEHDTPAALKAYAERFGAGPAWTFLTGNRENVNDVLHRLGQLAMTRESHTTLFLLGNVKTGHWMKLHPDSDPADIARALLALSDEPDEAAASPGAPGLDSSDKRATRDQRKDRSFTLKNVRASFGGGNR